MLLKASAGKHQRKKENQKNRAASQAGGDLVAARTQGVRRKNKQHKYIVLRVMVNNVCVLAPALQAS